MKLLRPHPPKKTDRHRPSLALGAFIALGFLLQVPARAAEDPGLARVRQFLDQVTMMRAAFHQDVVDPRGQVVEKSSGSLVMQRPGRFRWDYREPFERVIVSDGQRVWLYEADLAQVTVRPLTAGIGDTPAALLTGAVSVLDRFSVQRSWKEGGALWVALAPKSVDSDFASVKLGFDGQRLVHLELDDRLGQKTRIHFDHIEVNGQVAAETFTFVAPKGVDVISGGEP